MIAKVRWLKYKWLVEDFHRLRENYKVGQALYSNVFGDTYTWKLVLYPCGKRELTKKFVGVYLKNVTAPIEITDVKVKISLFDKRGKVVADSKVVVDFPSRRSCGQARFWRYWKSSACSSIVVVCELEFVEKKISASTESPKLVETIQRLRGMEQSSDFKINIALRSEEESRKFAVHRAVLASQSPVFAAMFDGEWRKKLEGTLELDSGVNVCVVDAMLDFLYSGLCTVDDWLLFDLLRVAKKFEIGSLTAFCEARLWTFRHEIFSGTCPDDRTASANRKF